VKKRERIDLNITPIIDVVFILFTFFLVATSFKKENSELNINLPNTKSYSDYKEDKKSVKIDIALKNIAINNKIIKINNFEEIIKELDRSKNIELKIDKDVNYHKISEILDILRDNNFNKISFITKKKKD